MSSPTHRAYGKRFIDEVVTLTKSTGRWFKPVLGDPFKNYPKLTPVGSGFGFLVYIYN